MESNIKKAKLALADMDQLKTALAIVEKARDVSYAAATQAQGKADAAEATFAEL